MTNINNIKKKEDDLMIIKGKKQISDLQMARRVWIIRDIIDRPLRQKDILELWRHRGKIEYEQMKKMVLAGWGGIVDTPNGERRATINDIKIFKPKEFKDGIGISKSSLSKVINSLVEENILKKTFVNGEKGYSLVKSVEALYKILNEFSRPLFSNYFIRELRQDLMNSEYAKELINFDLVKKSGYEFNEEELNFILIIIKISPSALLKFMEGFKTIAHIVDKHGNHLMTLDSEPQKRLLLMDLQFQAYNDISSLSPAEQKMTFVSPYPVDFKFEIKTTLKTKKREFKHTESIQRNSIELLSEVEKVKEVNKAIKMLEQFEEIQFPDIKIEGAEKIDKKFSLYLNSSPLQYEEKSS